jgi:hypothetical protein
MDRSGCLTAPGLLARRYSPIHVRSLLVMRNRVVGHLRASFAA